MASGIRERADEPSWFAVWTRSRQEATVRQEIAGRGLDVFLPTIPRWSRWKDRKKRIDWPLFPGYCFVRLAPRESLKVLACRGVAGLVSFDGRLAPISDKEIDAIRTLVASDVQFDPCPLLEAGDLVEVVRGPLRGVTGKLVRKGAKARLVLAVDLIGQGVSVEVDAADVRSW
jgi:transcriptional antiterminator NusG